MNFLKRLSNVMNTPIKDIEGYENLQKRINEKCAFLFCIVFDFHYLCTRYRKVSIDLSTSRSLFKQIENAESDLELKKRRLPMFMFPYSWDMGRGSISIEF